MNSEELVDHYSNLFENLPLLPKFLSFITKRLGLTGNAEALRRQAEAVWRVFVGGRGLREIKTQKHRLALIEVIAAEAEAFTMACGAAGEADEVDGEAEEVDEAIMVNELEMLLYARSAECEPLPGVHLLMSKIWAGWLLINSLEEMPDHAR